jgi:Glycosyl transferase family 2
MTIEADAGMQGVTVVLPAYREEANLEACVEDMLGALEVVGERHCVVIVDDGSDDRTGDIADMLAARHPGRVEVVHHEVNKGYGGAVRTGIATALDRTDTHRLFLTDSDGQFRASQLPWFVAEAVTERADAVIGFRPRRADPALRKVNAWLWTKACRLLLGVGARDVDCAYKLIDRRLLDGIDLRGDAGTISPELLMNIRARGARILQRPVDHFPRVHGEQTGAKLSVILVSLLGLAGLWSQRMRRAWPGRALDRLAHPRDPALATLTVISMAVSVIACLVYAGRHDVLADPETMARLFTARRVADAGLLQLGGTCLPLPQLLAVPTIWLDSWYHSGLSGVVVSMAAYVLATRYLYKTGLGLTGSRFAGLAAAVVFAANPDMLYLQSTPMTATVLAACAAAAIYHLMRWSQTGSYRQLAGTATAVLLASLTSYPGWALDGAVLLAVGYVAWRRAPGSAGTRVHAVEAHLVFYGLPALSGIVFWLVWSLRFPVHVQLRFVAQWFAPALSGSGSVPAWIALTWIALGGLGYYLARTRLRPETVAPLTLAVFLPRAAGVLVVLPAATFAGYLAADVASAAAVRFPRTPTRLRAAAPAVCAIAAVAVTAAAWAGGIGSLHAARAARASASQQADLAAGAWLRAHAGGGQVLMELAGNEAVAFAVPPGQVVDETSGGLWQPTLGDPLSRDIRWIYMSHNDGVWNRLHGSAELSRYAPVYVGPGRLIYERKTHDPAQHH